MPIMMIFAVIVGLLIIVGGVAAGLGLMSQSRSSNTVQDVAEITANVEGAYANQADFATLTNSLAIAQKLVPANMVQGANTIVDPFGGDVTLGPDPTISNGFDIQVGGLGNASCAAVAEDVSAYEVEINGTVAATNNTPVSPSTAQQDCTGGTGANTVTAVETQTNG